MILLFPIVFPPHKRVERKKGEYATGIWWPATLNMIYNVDPEKRTAKDAYSRKCRFRAVPGQRPKNTETMMIHLVGVCKDANPGQNWILTCVQNMVPLARIGRD